MGTIDARINKDLKEIDEVCRDLITFYELKGTHVILVSEYGITKVENPISINREHR